MESKARRAPRPSGPVEAPAEPHEAVEVPAVAAGPAATSIEPLHEEEIGAGAVAPPEMAGHAQPSTAAAIAEAAPSPGTSLEVKGAPSEDVVAARRDPLAALAQSQAALAHGLEALSAEMAGLALSGMDAVTRMASKMLGIRTLSDAIEVNAGFTCSSFDALVGGSARLSELGMKLAAETSQPLFGQLGRGWIQPARRGP